MIFDGEEEYTVVGKGNVKISYGGKISIFLAWSLIYYQLISI
jgi:hypothetical protein